MVAPGPPFFSRVAADDDYVDQQLEEDKFNLISEAKNKATVTNKPHLQKIEFLPTPKKPDFKVETIDKYAKKPNEDKLQETCHTVGSALNNDSLKKRRSRSSLHKRRKQPGTNRPRRRT